MEDSEKRDERAISSDSTCLMTHGQTHRDTRYPPKGDVCFLYKVTPVKSRVYWKTSSSQVQVPAHYFWICSVLVLSIHYLLSFTLLCLFIWVLPLLLSVSGQQGRLHWVSVRNSLFSRWFGKRSAFHFRRWDHLWYRLKDQAYRWCRSFFIGHLTDRHQSGTSLHPVSSTLVKHHSIVPFSAKLLKTCTYVTEIE